jgi:hypothetical protein
LLWHEVWITPAGVLQCLLSVVAFVGREAVSVYATLFTLDRERYRGAYHEALQMLSEYLQNAGRTEDEILKELAGFPSPEVD